MFRLPAIQALLIQLGSFFLILVTRYTVFTLIGVQISLVLSVFLQGVMAAALSRLIGLATWWMLIQFTFSAGLVIVPALHLPSSFFLAAFLFLLALYWTTFSTQVPLFPSRHSTWESVLGMLPEDHAVRFVDVGSGLGGLVMHLAERRIDSTFLGVEVAPLPWLISILRMQFRRSRGRFMRRDYRQLNFGDYDIVFAYLSPAVMPAIWKKACIEMRPGSLLLSYEFTIADAKPHIITPQDIRGAVLYGWHM